MRLANLLGPDLKETIASDPAALEEALEEFHPEDIAEILSDLSDEDAVALMKALPAEMGAEVMERLAAERQAVILKGLGAEEAVPLLTEMSPDDRVDMVQELPEEEAKELLDELEKVEPEVAEELRELGSWGPETAGGLMTTEYVSLPPDKKVWEAIEEVRRISREREAETIYYVYVCGYGGKLLGVVSLRDLILREPGQALEDVMTENVVRVLPTDDQERVADAIAKYDLSAIPVCDENGRMLGVVTIDDVVDVVIEEATEDAQLMGGVVPLEDSYFETGALEFVWKRGAWLVVLFLGQLLTASVMEHNEDTLRTTLQLAIFIPLIIASGGNSGAQSSSLIIRGLAVGEVRPGDWLKVLLREVGVGVLLGVGLGVIAFLRALLIGEAHGLYSIALTVGVSVIAVVVLGATIGALLPLAIRRAGMDPAVSSTPFVASVIDVIGLVVYFELARVILGAIT